MTRPASQPAMSPTTTQAMTPPGESTMAAIRSFTLRPPFLAGVRVAIAENRPSTGPHEPVDDHWSLIASPRPGAEGARTAAGPHAGTGRAVRRTPRIGTGWSNSPEPTSDPTMTVASEV